MTGSARPGASRGTKALSCAGEHVNSQDEIRLAGILNWIGSPM
jgi:hypothetical protein